MQTKNKNNRKHTRWKKVYRTYHTEANNGSTICIYFLWRSAALLIICQKCQQYTSAISWKKKLMFHCWNLLKCTLDIKLHVCLVCLCVCVLHTIFKCTTLTVQPGWHSPHELGYRLHNPAHQGQNIFIFLKMSRINLRPNQHPIQKGQGVLSLGGRKRSWHEVDFSPYTSIPRTCLRGRHRKNI